MFLCCRWKHSDSLLLQSERIKIILFDLHDEARHDRLLRPSRRRHASSADSDWLGRAGGGAPRAAEAQPAATEPGDVPDH